MLLALSASAPDPANSRKHTASHTRQRTDDFEAQQTGSIGLLRAAGPGKAAAACSSSSCECEELEKQIDFAALKSTV